MRASAIVAAGAVVVLAIAACGYWLLPNLSSRLSEIVPYIGWGLVGVLFVVALKSRRNAGRDTPTKN